MDDKANQHTMGQAFRGAVIGVILLFVALLGLPVIVVSLVTIWSVLSR